MLKFGAVKGEAGKGADYFKWNDGENVFRMVGGILPRYVYWLKHPTDAGKTLVLESLEFDRDKEEFTRMQKDYAKEYFTDDKGKPVYPSWSYVCYGFDRGDGKLKVIPLKKKMFSQIMDFYNQVEVDIAGYESGYDMVVEKKKTGPMVFNVEYSVSQIKMIRTGPTALTEDEIKQFEEAKPLEELFPRDTETQQRKKIEDFLKGANTPTEEDADKEAIDELNAA